MFSLMDYSDQQIVQLVQEGWVSAADFIDSGICPTCFDRKHKHILYGDNSDKILYEDDDFECFLADNPRAEGHVIISTKKHFKDMSEADDAVLEKIFVFAKQVMNYIKDVYQCESVYLCTMCDGPMNHFHIQLIPRYQYEKRGSKNFVKLRKLYLEDTEKITKMRNLLNLD